VSLPRSVIVEDVTATLQDDGALTVTVPKDAHRPDGTTSSNATILRVPIVLLPPPRAAYAAEIKASTLSTATTARIEIAATEEGNEATNNGPHALEPKRRNGITEELRR
jgi:hypothetical protein